MRSWLRRTLARSARPRLAGSDAFLVHCKGVVHVGANTGQERETYRLQGLRVLWLEPIPEVYRKLVENLAHYPDQHAIQALVTDRDGDEYTLHVASNEGASSSILEFGKHADIWPEVTFERNIQVKGVTLASVMHGSRHKPEHYDALVLDTQGSELLVLKGAGPLLKGFRYIKVEVPDFESYVGCCTLSDVIAYLATKGFGVFSKHSFAEHPDGGRYYDVVFSRVR
jgi:FkbM family methyltransferase